MTYQREVRLGLVLYGGVSLAVYENGIAQEIYRAMRGEGVYGLLSKLIDSDIVVDIISGTSAGGVNGIMLAYALANQRSFSPCASLWLEDGDIQKLMRTPSDPQSASILSSDYYQSRLESCYQDTLAPDLTAPAIGELDLFVTSTDANGAISTVFDDLGHAIDIKNHRALFMLSYRGARKNDLNAPPSDLAKLSRMTSCFPVAFEPVTVEATEERFFRWGKLRNPAVYLDGGILNNKPFTSTINAIATRTATREVERFLIYVEPNPEQFAPTPDNPPSPPMVQAAVSSLMSIPGYQSIAGDLEEIEAHNERAGRMAEILNSLPDAPTESSDCLLQASVLLPEGEERDAVAYYAARYIQLRDVAVGGILDDSKGRGYFPVHHVLQATPGATGAVNPDAQATGTRDDRRSARILVQSFDAWEGDGTITFKNYDVFFRMRRTKHLMNTLMRAAKAETDVPNEVWETVNHYFKLYEMAKWGMLRLLTVYDLNWQRLSGENPKLDILPKEDQQKKLREVANEIWGQVVKRMEPFMFAAVPVPTTITSEAREEFYESLRKVQQDPSQFQKREANLLDAIDGALKQALLELEKSQHSPTVAIGHLLRDEFCRFVEVDRQLFLVQIGSDFESTDLIRVVRFSPLDAQRYLSEGPVQNKVRGITLGAFGGFFKKNWRANDIMMGRLDASCLLLECLLTKERLAALGQRRTKAPVTVTEAELRSYLPALKDKAADLAKLINDYLAAPGGATTTQWNNLINQIVAPYHDEIFAIEFPRVVECAIEQEYDWGRYAEYSKAPALEPFDRKNLAWRRAKERPDAVLVQIAAQRIAAGEIPPFAPGLQIPGKFLDEIPDSVLEELGGLAVDRLGRGLLNSIEDAEIRQRVAKSPFYTIPFNWIGPIVYRFARMRRTQPDSVVVFNTAIPIVCLTIVLVEALLYFVLQVKVPGRVLLETILPALLVLVVWFKFFRR